MRIERSILRLYVRKKDINLYDTNYFSDTYLDFYYELRLLIFNVKMMNIKY